MMRRIFPAIPGVVLGSALILAMAGSDRWYLYPGLLFSYLVVWKFGRPVPAWRFAQLMAGEVAAVASAQVSLYYGIAVQCSAIAIVLLQTGIPASKTEGYWFLIYTGIVAGSALLVDLSPGLLLPCFIMLLAGGIAALYMHLDRHRLVRMYRGDGP
jgi:hypothetical protein